MGNRAIMADAISALRSAAANSGALSRVDETPTPSRNTDTGPQVVRGLYYCTRKRLKKYRV